MPPSDNGHVDSLPSHEVLNQPSRFDFSGFLELLLCMVFVLLSLIFHFSGLKVNERTIPYQSTENGDILLDFSLMHSVSDMTFSGMYKLVSLLRPKPRNKTYCSDVILDRCRHPSLSYCCVSFTYSYWHLSYISNKC